MSRFDGFLLSHVEKKHRLLIFLRTRSPPQLGLSPHSLKLNRKTEKSVFLAAIVGENTDFMKQPNRLLIKFCLNESRGLNSLICFSL